jgi:hypothetical protein
MQEVSGSIPLGSTNHAAWRYLLHAGLQTEVFCASGAHDHEGRSAPVLEASHFRSGLKQISPYRGARNGVTG